MIFVVDISWKASVAMEDDVRMITSADSRTATEKWFLEGRISVIETQREIRERFTGGTPRVDRPPVNLTDPEDQVRQFGIQVVCFQ